MRRLFLPCPMRLLILLAFAVSGCVPALYAPAPIHTPDVERAGDVQVGVDVAYGLGGHVALSPLPHVVLVGAASGYGGERGADRSAEGGAGVYARVGRGGRVEVLAGRASGYVRAVGAVRDGSLFGQGYALSADHTRRFAQLSVSYEPPGRCRRAWITFDACSIGAAVRGVDVHFRNLRRSDGAAAGATAREAYVEPVVFTRTEAGPVGFEFQGGLSFQARRRSAEPFTHHGYALAFGLTLDANVLAALRR